MIPVAEKGRQDSEKEVQSCNGPSESSTSVPVGRPESNTTVLWLGGHSRCTSGPENPEVAVA